MAVDFVTKGGVETSHEKESEGGGNIGGNEFGDEFMWVSVGERRSVFGDWIWDGGGGSEERGEGSCRVRESVDGRSEVELHGVGGIFEVSGDLGMPNRRDVVLVNWVDAASLTSRWTDQEVLLSRAREPYAVMSAGIVLEDAAKYLAIGLSMDLANDKQGNDPMWDHCLQIPRGMIKRVRVLSRAVVAKPKKRKK